MFDYIYSCVYIKSFVSNIISQYNVLVIHIKACQVFDHDRKGTNHPTADELRRSYLFSGVGPKTKDSNNQNKRDITLIIGSDDGSDYGSILLCRFHKFDANLNEVQKEALLSSTWDALNSRKFECRRTGGSSGTISLQSSKSIKKLIKTPGSSPRNGHGSIWIQGTDTWCC